MAILSGFRGTALLPSACLSIRHKYGKAKRGCPPKLAFLGHLPDFFLLFLNSIKFPNPLLNPQTAAWEEGVVVSVASSTLLEAELGPVPSPPPPRTHPAPQLKTHEKKDLSKLIPPRAPRAPHEEGSMAQQQPGIWRP